MCLRYVLEDLLALPWRAKEKMNYTCAIALFVTMSVPSGVDLALPLPHGLQISHIRVCVCSVAEGPQQRPAAQRFDPA